jgi:hypothetical protein
VRSYRGGVVLSAVLTSAVALAGCASAAPPATAHRGTAVATTAAAGPAASGKTQLAVYSINSDGPRFRSILTGAIGDYGPAVTIYPDDKIDPAHTSQLELKLTHGSFRLGIARLDQAFAAAASHEPIYPRTGFGTVTPLTPGP